MEMRNQKLPFATWVRAVSAILIFMCHCCNECDEPLVAMLAQLFNIGVHLFFILSGFLVGYKGISVSYGKWYTHKIRRIGIPYWLFLVVLAIVYRILDLNFTKEWLLLVVGLQGSRIGVVGAEHTWFLTALILCYVVTPGIDYVNKRISTMRKKGVHSAIVILICILPVVYALFEDAWVYTLLTPLSIYTLAYLQGTKYGKHSCIRSQQKTLKWEILVVLLSLSIRFAVRAIADGTIWYDRVTVPYTHAIAAFAIFAIAERLVGKSEVPWIIAFISDVSFEIYLYHYMFTYGPVSLFDYTYSWLLNSVLAFLLMIPIAFISNRTYTFFIQRKKP